MTTQTSGVNRPYTVVLMVPDVVAQEDGRALLTAYIATSITATHAGEAARLACREARKANGNRFKDRDCTLVCVLGGHTTLEMIA